MKAAILTIGSELLTPGREDAHSGYLIERLAHLGIPVLSRATVGDDRTLVASAARHAVEVADLVVATGGLGPTSDDVTREGFADALSLELTVDEGVLEAIGRRFARRGLEMPQVNQRQAMVPKGAEVLSNPAGTAPGLWLEWGERRRRIVLLPGPPHEMHAVFEEQVLPRLRGAWKGAVYRTRRIRVAGLAESAVEAQIGSTYRGLRNPTTSLLASAGQVEIRLTGRGESSEEAEDAIEKVAAAIRRSLGHHIFSERGEMLEQVVGSMLARRTLTLALAESCTGGLISHRLTEVPGSSSYLERCLVTYSDKSKVELLDVSEKVLRDHGAVSEPVARAMAGGARRRAGTDIGLAVTGIAGPGGGSPDKPVGLVYIALSDADGEEVRRYLLPGPRSQVKQWAAGLALNHLRLRLSSLK